MDYSAHCGCGVIIELCWIWTRFVLGWETLMRPISMVN